MANSAIENFLVTGLTITVTGLTIKSKTWLQMFFEQNFATDPKTNVYRMNPTISWYRSRWI